MLCFIREVILIGKSLFVGSLKAYASSVNPLQTIVELVITPFGPNSNKQRIPKSEAENILQTCLHQPIKIDLNGESLGGHKGSIPVGPIISAEETDDSIIGTGIIWQDEFPEVSEFLKERTAENNPPGTSWELYYEESKIADDGVEDLYGVIYGANTIVSNPSYGNRTLLRAVAEDLGVAELEVEREQIAALQTQLAAMYEVLDSAYYTTFEIEAVEAARTENVESFSARFNELISVLTNRANEVGIALASAKEELDVLKAEKAQAEKEKKIAERNSILSDVGIALAESDKELIMGMCDNEFELYIRTAKQFQSATKVNAEVKIKLPDPVGTQDIDNKDIIEAHKNLYKR